MGFLDNLSQVEKETLFDAMKKAASNQSSLTSATQEVFSNPIDLTHDVGTSTSGAATVDTQTGTITTEALTTAAGATYSFTLTNKLIATDSHIAVTVGKGTATTGTMTVTWITPSTGSCVIIFQNIHASAAVNGTITISYVIF